MFKKIGLVLLLLLLFSSLVLAQEKEKCLTCHRGLMKGLVKDWERSKHSQNGVSCSICHGDKHNSPANVKLALMPTIETWRWVSLSTG